jgi:hypothetical protein
LEETNIEEREENKGSSANNTNEEIQIDNESIGIKLKSN